jgi:hypothetical protein
MRFSEEQVKKLEGQMRYLFIARRSTQMKNVCRSFKARTKDGVT